MDMEEREEIELVLVKISSALKLLVNVLWSEVIFLVLNLREKNIYILKNLIK